MRGRYAAQGAVLQKALRLGGLGLTGRGRGCFRRCRCVPVVHGLSTAWAGVTVIVYNVCVCACVLACPQDYSSSSYNIKWSQDCWWVA